MTITGDRTDQVDRARAWAASADPIVREAWRGCVTVAAARAAPVGLADGDRPVADVEVLAGAMAAAECALALRMHAATAGGAAPFPAPGGLLRARQWSPPLARRLARCGAFASRHPDIAETWGAGIITSEHVDPIARQADRFSGDELTAVLGELAPHWGRWSPAMIARFVTAADRLLHPPPDPTGAEAEAHAGRSLSFAVTSDRVILAGELPRVEGELVMAAIEAVAERLRSTADHVPAGARRADALVQLVNDAHAADLIPTRGGLPVSLTVTLERTDAGDPLWTTSRGHLLTIAEARWASCDAVITPVVVANPTSRPGEAAGPATRVAALAASMFGTRIPLDVGRTQRTATAAQRRALAVRDRGCIIPGCDVPAEACQTHHLQDWAEDGRTDQANLALMCWAHHRQVDLRLWEIEARAPGEAPPPEPGPSAPAGTAWPANRGAPFVIRRVPHRLWRN
jgi:hypothetical protein